MTTEMKDDEKLILAHELVKQLGPGWRVLPLDDTRELRQHADLGVRTFQHTDGYGFWINWTARPGRLEIKGTWPTDRTGRLYTPKTVYTGTTAHTPRAEITIAATTNADAVHKAIATRLLPTYIPLWHQCIEEAEQWNQEMRATRETIRRLVDAGVARAPSDAQLRDDAVDVTLYSSAEAVYRLRVQGARVDLDLRGIAADEAVAILTRPAILKRLDRGAPCTATE